jgi:hypothetical protein
MHDHLETAFARALFAAEVSPPPEIVAPAGRDPTRRFGVYRNNVVSGLVSALASRFPVTERLVGAEFFRAMASLYVTEDPPRSPILFRYGSAFPAFIESFEPAASVPYLADLARLELARGAAYHAADAEPLPASAFAGLDVEAFQRTGLRLHPSLILLTSPYPIVSIWRAHQDSGEPFVESWAAEAAMIARPGLEVEVHRLPAGGFQFLIALLQGSSMSRAAAVAAAEARAFDPAENLAMLLKTRIPVSFAPPRLS